MLVLAAPKAGGSSQATQCTLAPSALASILDHHLRRATHKDKTDHDRVFGALLGQYQAGGIVHVSSAVGTPYDLINDELKIDLEDVDNGLIARSVAGAQIVGWYSTAAALNSYTPLIHEKYTAVAANPASVVHLTLDPASFQYVAYTAQPHLGRPNAIFAPLRTELRVDEAERAGFDLLIAQPASTSLTPPTPLAHLSSLLASLSTQLQSTIAYVEKAVADPNSAEARNTPLRQALAKGLDGVAVLNDSASREHWEEASESHIADVLLLSYLSNLAKLQMEVAGRLSLLPDRERGGFDRGAQKA